MIIGYARTSTADQIAGLDAQLRDLKAAGAEKVFAEQVSSVAQRDKLDAALQFAREGDTLIVCKLDRLARSVAGFLDIESELTRRGVGIVILSMGGEKLDTRSPTSRFILTLLAAVAQFEREIMLERQREGIAKAKADGKFKGRAPTARNQTDAILAAHNAGAPHAAICESLGVSLSSIKRVLASAREAGQHVAVRRLAIVQEAA